MKSDTVDLDTTQGQSPGWRELVESLHQFIDDARIREQAALRREEFYRQQVIALQQQLATVRAAGASPGPPPVAPSAAAPVAPPAPVRPAAKPGPVARPARKPPPLLHAQILAVLEAKGPLGSTHWEVAKALWLQRNLDDVLRGMVRYGHCRIVGPGLFAARHSTNNNTTREIDHGPSHRT